MSRYDDDPVLDREVLQALRGGLACQDPPAELRTRILDRARSSLGAAGLLTVRDAGDDWRTLFPGLDYKMLVYDEHGGTKSFLLRAQAGVRLPAHEHHGFEECLVLEGAFCLGDLKLNAGDFHAAREGVVHGEAHTETGVTVYLRASILDYPGVDP